MDDCVQILNSALQDLDDKAVTKDINGQTTRRSSSGKAAEPILSDSVLQKQASLAEESQEKHLLSSYETMADQDKIEQQQQQQQQQPVDLAMLVDCLCDQEVLAKIIQLIKERTK